MKKLLSCLTPFCRWLVVVSPILWLTGILGDELPCSIVAILFLVHSAHTRDWRWLQQGWVKLLLVLWVVMVTRAAFSEFAAQGLQAALPWVRFPMFAAACATWLLPDVPTQRRLALSFAIAALFLVGDMLLQYTLGHDLFGHPRITIPGYERLTGPFNKPRAGMIAAWLLLPALGYATSRWFATRHVLHAVGIVLFTVAAITAIYLSGERMALLLSLMGVTLFCLLQRRLWLLLPVLALLSVGSIATMNALNPTVAARQVGTSHAQITGYWQSPYGQIMLSALKMAKQHPLLGVGTRNFRYLCPRSEYGATDADTLGARCANHTHNNYTEWLAEEGILGLGLYLAALGVWVGMAWKHRQRIFTDPIAASIFTFLAMRLFPLAATPSQLVAWTAVPFWLAAGYLLARLHTPRND